MSDQLKTATAPELLRYQRAWANMQEVAAVEGTQLPHPDFDAYLAANGLTRFKPGEK